jgi:hypothetical protein
MQNNILNTDTRTFFITFLYQSTSGKFIFQDASELLFILKNYDKNGIDKIQEFNPTKGKFEKVSKADLLSCFSWETELQEYLKTHYYFKK